MRNRAVTVQADPALPEAQAQAWEIAEPAATAAPFPFARFTYSVTEVSSFAGRTRVKSRTTRLEEGKLVSETFDGELDGSAFVQMAQQANALFASQMKMLMLPFSWMQPRSRDRDK